MEGLAAFEADWRAADAQLQQLTREVKPASSEMLPRPFGPSRRPHS